MIYDDTLGSYVEIFQRYRSSNEPLVLDSSYEDEIAATADMIVLHDTSIHLLMKGDFNSNPYQPSSSYNSHNWYFNLIGAKSEEVDNTHTAHLQYGDSLQAKQEANLSSWDAAETLENLNSSNLENSLQGRVLAQGGFMRLYDVEGLIDTDLNIVAQFFDAVKESILQFQDILQAQTTTIESTSSEEAVTTIHSKDLVTFVDSKTDEILLPTLTRSTITVVETPAETTEHYTTEEIIPTASLDSDTTENDATISTAESSTTEEMVSSDVVVSPAGNTTPGTKTNTTPGTTATTETIEIDTEAEQSTTADSTTDEKLPKSSTEQNTTEKEALCTTAESLDFSDTEGEVQTYAVHSFTVQLTKGLDATTKAPESSTIEFGAPVTTSISITDKATAEFTSTEAVSMNADFLPATMSLQSTDKNEVLLAPTATSESSSDEAVEPTSIREQEYPSTTEELLAVKNEGSTTIDGDLAVMTDGKTQSITMDGM
jgi:hypothetical protein